MKNTLLVNATFRDNSRSFILAQRYLQHVEGRIQIVDLSSSLVHPLNQENLASYLAGSKDEFKDEMFDFAKQFAEVDEVIIVAPFYNFTIPAALHCYLEMVCSQGVTFDLDADGNYVSLCKAKKLVYIETAGGYVEEKDDHSFGYIKTINEQFLKIPSVVLYRADGIDLVGNDARSIMDKVLAKIDSDF